MLDYDDTEYPLVRMTISGVRTPEDDSTYMRRIETLLDAGDRFVMVVDDRSTQCRPAVARRWRGLWWALSHRGRLRRMCVAMAIAAAEDHLARVDRTTRRLQQLSPVPTSLFYDVEMADTWAHSRLASEDGRSVEDRRTAVTVRRMLGRIRTRRAGQVVEPV